MNKKIWLVIYIAVFAIDLFAVYANNENIRLAGKPWLMPLLVIFFLTSTKNFSSSLKKWIVLALVFSWTGDVLLMFEPRNNSFFIFGLIAFLIAHIFYITFYENILRIENLRRNYRLFIPVFVYYIVLIYLLSPRLGAMKLPVWFYGLVISYMLVQALQTARIRDRLAFLLMVPGAILFVASDSLLAINKFYRSFEYGGVAVMLTYGIAQLLITLGAVRYISSGSSHTFAVKSSGLSS